MADCCYSIGAMTKRKSFVLVILLTMFLTACSSSEQTANQATATAQPAPEAKPQPDANNANVVKAEGQVAIIPPAPQPVTLPATVPPAKAPKIELPMKKADFGKVDQDKHLVKNFVVKNTGKAPLNIESVTPS
jgi:cell wall-associated NlpC family hydrolase